MSDLEPDKEEFPRLLLVEDSETSAELISRQLHSLYDVLHVSNGEEAWEVLLVDRTIELVITDIEMPRMNGQELLAKIRASDIPEVKALPVLVLTAFGDTRQRDLAFESGANDFITKPINTTELQTRVALHQKLARSIRELEASRKKT